MIRVMLSGCPQDTAAEEVVVLEMHHVRVEFRQSAGHQPIGQSGDVDVVAQRQSRYGLQGQTRLAPPVGSPCFRGGHD